MTNTENLVYKTTRSGVWNSSNTCDYVSIDNICDIIKISKYLAIRNICKVFMIWPTIYLTPDILYIHYTVKNYKTKIKRRLQNHPKEPELINNQKEEKKQAYSYTTSSTYLGYSTISMSRIPKDSAETFPIISLNFKKGGPVI